MSIIERQFDGNIIGQRSDNGFINATAMCTAHGKQVVRWLRQEETFEVFSALAKKLGVKSNMLPDHDLDVSRLSASDYVKMFPGLIIVRRGAPDLGGGTWIHYKLATPLAQKCNADFALLVSDWVEEWLMTGQNPIQARNRVDEYWLTQVREQHQPWEQFFDESFRREAERVSQYKWEWRVMAKFINSCIYDYFPKEMRDRLDKVNPFNPDTGCRPRKQHQHLEDDAQKSLRQHIRTVQTLMEVSYNKNEFDRLIAAKFNGQIQPYLWM